MDEKTANVVRRLEILQGKLEMEGSYVSANTVAMALEVIREQDLMLDLVDQVSAAPGENSG